MIGKLKTIKWNYDRKNIRFSRDLEESMLAEEAQEFKDGLAMILDQSSTEEQEIGGLIEIIDAWCDYKFVLTGTIYKYLGCNTAINLENFKTQEEYMRSILYELGLDDEFLEVCYNLVVEANTVKGSKRVNGKIQKGSSWRDPKESIREALYNV